MVGSTVNVEVTCLCHVFEVKCDIRLVGVVSCVGRLRQLIIACIQLAVF